MPFDSSAIKLETLTADVIKCGIQQRVSPQMRDILRTASVKAAVIPMIESMVDDMVVQLETTLVSKTTEQVDMVYWPETWWDHFKERWFPQWAIDRWPVNYKSKPVMKTVHNRMCPHIAPDPTSRHVNFLFRKGEVFGMPIVMDPTCPPDQVWMISK